MTQTASNRELYNLWSETYDRIENKTRDLESIACRETLASLRVESVIELGCGTGKNTIWLAEKAERLLAVDLSEEMQAIAKQKITGGNVDFALADISKSWDFALNSKADLIICSLILEHVSDLNFVFREAQGHLKPGGHFYVAELHPFKQYSGSKARFETGEGETQVLDCFIHHISDYTQAARENSFKIVYLNEWFDDNDRSLGIPRLISFLFERQ